MSSLPGGGVCPVEGGGGCLYSAQLALMGGRGKGGLWHLKTLVTCLGSQGTLCPCSLLMIRVGRPWNLLLLLVGPGPFSLMHSARSNKSSSEGDTSCLTFFSECTFLIQFSITVLADFPFLFPFNRNTGFFC
jgi:hypothetical protein